MNRVVKAMQRLGVRTGPAMILTVPGRKTGKPRSTPMTPFTYRGDLYTVAGYPGADWAANARAAGAGTLSRGRRSREIRIVELNAEESRPVLREFPGQVPVGVAFAKRSGLVQEGTPDEFEALAGQLAVFRFDPVELADDACRRALHGDVTGAGSHTSRLAFRHLRQDRPSACRLLRTFARMGSQVELGRGTLVDPDFGVATTGLHEHPAVDRGRDGDVTGRGLGVDTAVSCFTDSEPLAARNLMSPASLPIVASPDAVEMAPRPARFSTAVPPEALSALRFPVTNPPLASPLPSRSGSCRTRPGVDVGGRR